MSGGQVETDASRLKSSIYHESTPVKSAILISIEIFNRAGEITETRNRKNISIYKKTKSSKEEV
jgi:hypothetical protein